MDGLVLALWWPFKNASPFRAVLVIEIVRNARHCIILLNDEEGNTRAEMTF